MKCLALYKDTAPEASAEEENRSTYFADIDT